MELFDEKIKKSLEKVMENDELNSEIIEYIVDRVVNDAIDYDNHGNTDLMKQAKYILNRLIEKAKEKNI